MDISFLKSNRFWALIGLTGFYFLHAQGLVDSEIYGAAFMFFGGFIGIRTVDRLSEKMGNK